ncbi:MAG: hypothetical protein EBT86_00155 [Actinobacteria bacterium]|nr:hypothetical protein [Actinomycetota bacterium]
MSSNQLSTQNPNEIGSLIRNWVHYDNMSSSFYKQTLNARKIRSEYESKILTNLNQNKMENAIIQINGGRLGLVEEKQPATLTIQKIEDLLHNYFKTRKQTDQTSDILDFIKQNRGVSSQTRLRYLDQRRPTN